MKYNAIYILRGRDDFWSSEIRLTESSAPEHADIWRRHFGRFKNGLKNQCFENSQNLGMRFEDSQYCGVILLKSHLGSLRLIFGALISLMGSIFEQKWWISDGPDHWRVLGSATLKLHLSSCINLWNQR